MSKPKPEETLSDGTVVVLEGYTWRRALYDDGYGALRIDEQAAESACDADEQVVEVWVAKAEANEEKEAET